MKGRKWGPNPSNPFVTEERPIEHIDGVVEDPFGTTARPMRIRWEGYDAGVLDEMRRLKDSYSGGKKGS